MARRYKAHLDLVAADRRLEEFLQAASGILAILNREAQNPLLDDKAPMSLHWDSRTNGFVLVSKAVALNT